MGKLGHYYSIAVSINGQFRDKRGISSLGLKENLPGKGVQVCLGRLIQAFTRSIVSDIDTICSGHRSCFLDETDSIIGHTILSHVYFERKVI